MAIFDYDFLLKLEGIRDNDPDDSGGDTRYGISSAFLADNYPHLNINDITKDKARELYLDYFWNPLNLGSIYNQELANEILEMCVNIGRETGAKIVQKAVALWFPEIEIDGDIGPVTLNYLNTFKHQKALISLIDYYQIRHYLSIVENNPRKKKFLTGWLNRS